MVLKKEFECLFHIIYKKYVGIDKKKCQSYIQNHNRRLASQFFLPN